MVRFIGKYAKMGSGDMGPAGEHILALVEFLGEDTHRTHYLRQPFRREPDFGVTSVNYDFAELLARAEAPR